MAIEVGHALDEATKHGELMAEQGYDAGFAMGKHAASKIVADAGYISADKRLRLFDEIEAIQPGTLARLLAHKGTA